MKKQGRIFLLEVEFFPPPPMIPTVNFFPFFCRKLAIYATKHNYITTFQVVLRHFASQTLSVIINVQLFIHFFTFLTLLPIIL